MVKEQCIGMMVHFIKDNGNKGYKMDKESYLLIKNLSKEYFMELKLYKWSKIPNLIVIK